MSFKYRRKRLIQTDYLIFAAMGYTLIIVWALVCVIPFVLVLSGSFTDEKAIYKYGYNLIPREFSLSAYKMVFNYPDQVLRAYAVTIGVTVIGTIVGLYLTAMTAYVLSKKELKTRNFFSLYFYFTTLFSGGLVPWYILMIRYLGMRNNFLALILPLLFNVFYIIVMRSFMSTIPDALSESAKIDGANEFTIFMKIVLPLSKPALATIGLFIAIRYWNDWYNAMLFIKKETMYPLQYFLYQLLSSAEFARQAAQLGAIVNEELPAESFKLAMTVVATGPIVLLFPFIQKYFIKGLTIGAVKG